MKKLALALCGLLFMGGHSSAAVLDFTNKGDDDGFGLSFDLGNGLSMDAIGGEAPDPDDGSPYADFATMFGCDDCAPNGTTMASGLGLGSGSGLIDTHGSNEDILLLWFSEDVQITGLTFSWFDSDNQQDPGQADIAHFYAVDFVAESIELLDSFYGQDNDGDPETFGGLNFTGSLFAIGAAEIGDGDSDYWLASIEYETLADVPAPASLPLLALGLIAISGAVRRRA